MVPTPGWGSGSPLHRGSGGREPPRNKVEILGRQPPKALLTGPFKQPRQNEHDSAAPKPRAKRNHTEKGGQIRDSGADDPGGIPLNAGPAAALGPVPGRTWPEDQARRGGVE